MCLGLSFDSIYHVFLVLEVCYSCYSHGVDVTVMRTAFAHNGCVV